MKTRLLFLMFMSIGFTSCNCNNWTDLTPDEFEKSYIADGTVTIDVRTADEFAQGHLYHAVNIDWQKDGFMDEIKENFNTTLTLAIYCRSGKRSAAAAQALSDAGYKVLNLTGGYTAWTEAGKMTNSYQVEYIPAGGGNDPLVITLIKHGSLEFAYKGMSVQIDPVSGYGKNTDYAKEFPKADAILITHEHGDHLDKNAITALSSDKTEIILNAKSQQQIGLGRVLANGEFCTLFPVGISVWAVPAYNTTPGREQFHPKGNGNGYLLSFLGSLSAYVAGDTEDIPEMVDIPKIRPAMRISVAFLPVNQPYTMTVDQCVNAAKMVNPEVLIPYHFSQTDLSGLTDRLPGMKVLLRDMQ
ncbi:MAG: MBL fold metallo-hydrolase [Bacteroidaceae bacterium]|nr:MBL fold metallo-hydrolase [Bacteroidaceae bacterium]